MDAEQQVLIRRKPGRNVQAKWAEEEREGQCDGERAGVPGYWGGRGGGLLTDFRRGNPRFLLS